MPAQKSFGYELFEVLVALANARAADDFGRYLSVREVFDLNRFAEGSETLTNDSGLRDGAHAAIIAPVAVVVAPVIPTVVALILVITVVLRKVRLRRSKDGSKSKRSYKKR